METEWHKESNDLLKGPQEISNKAGKQATILLLRSIVLDE